MHQGHKKSIASTAHHGLLSGAVIAMAAASWFTSAQAAPSSSEEAIVHCAGVNACKGQGRCATAEHSCKGANACKGQGILPLTKKECEAKGGYPKDLPPPKG